MASTRKKFHEIIMKEKTFKDRVAEKSIDKLEVLYDSLFTYGKENIEELQLLELEQMECDAHERSDYGRFISLVSFQHRRADWMMEELFRRCRKWGSTITKKASRIKILKEENDNFRKSLKEMTRKRDKLQRERTRLS